MSEREIYLPHISIDPRELVVRLWILASYANVPLQP